MENSEVIGKALVFIENNLYQPITAGSVAQAAAYSYAHFHRYFQAAMGETIGSYIRGRRLAQAAWLLVHTRKRVLDIALSLYFETAESFARAFKVRYGMTPTRYRQNGVDVLLGTRKPALAQSDAAPALPPVLGPALVDVAPISLMGLRYTMSVADNAYAPLWQRLEAELEKLAAPALRRANRYLVFETGPACDANAFTLDTPSTAFVGVAVPPGCPVPGSLDTLALAGGCYARFVYTGAVSGLMRAYEYIWGVWYPKSGLKLAPRDDFECYTGRFLGALNEKSETDIYFPVEEQPQAE